MPKEDFEGRMVIWPVFLDCNYPRSLGRRLSLDACVKSPSVQEIVKAARDLGLNPAFDEASYPRLWYEIRGRVIVDKKMGRQETLKVIASRIKSMRS
ncbi:signal recognition particle subunit SRP19/SEC65 family protein [Acidilobus sp.]|uniref:signal recognition particle subunit SRP19/SEC65 family protein n=1 Tax=Acidilobus sp. TaxID=1872109 RepID=UPI003CFEB531